MAFEMADGRSRAPLVASPAGRGAFCFASLLKAFSTKRIISYQRAFRTKGSSAHLGLRACGIANLGEMYEKERENE